MTTENNEVRKIKRSEYASFLEIEGKLVRMGKGISELQTEYSAETKDEKYIDEDNTTTIIDGYTVSNPVTQTAYKGNPIFEFIDGLRRKRAIDSDAETSFVKGYIYDELGEAVYEAEKTKCVIEIKNFSGNSIEYTIHENGDPVEGYITIANKEATFTKGTYVEQTPSV